MESIYINFCLTGFHDQFGKEDRKEAEDACMP